MTQICITGSHRSGTSMVTRLLHLSGLYLGDEKDINSRASDNPEGFWENLHFVNLNKDILAAQGGAWDMPPRLAPHWELMPNMAPLITQARLLTSQFEDQSLWGWKDPRSALTIEFWRLVLPDMQTLICVRNPLDVVRSLSKRGYTSPQFGFHLWTEYNRILVNTIPAKHRIITHYDAYFTHPRLELERILGLLGINASEDQLSAALGSIAPPLRHNHSSWDEIFNYNPSQEMLAIYRELCLQAGPHYRDSMQTGYPAEWQNLLQYEAPQKPVEILPPGEQIASQLAAKNNEIEALYQALQVKEQDLQIAAGALQNIHNDVGWHLVSFYRSVLNKLAPNGSLARRVHDLPYRLYRRMRNQLKGSLPSGGQQAADPETPPGTAGTTAICTIASKNYLSQVRIFANSAATSNPGIPVYLLLVDRPDGFFDPTAEPFTVITIEELSNIPDVAHFFFKYTPIELNTAAKPYFLEHLFKHYHFQKICYFDPDIFIFSSLAGLWKLLQFNSLVLTPHITSPYQDDHHPTEMDINLAGIFNLGFIGISDTPTTHEFLAWWQQRLYYYGFMKPAEGMHVDQNWVNFAPVMHNSVFILRDNAYNIAYWNLHERGNRLLFEDNQLYFDDRPAVFFHFSGFNPESPETISTHQSRFLLSDLPRVRPIYEFYRALLGKYHYKKIKSWPYAFGQFDNGVAVAAIMRGLYNQQNLALRTRFANPYQTTGPDSFFSWMNQPVDGRRDSFEQPAITHLQMEMHRQRPDLQQAFPDPLGADRLRFHNWLLQRGTSDFGVDPIFLRANEPARPGNINTISFETRNLFFNSHRWLKHKASRLNPNTRIFQNLRYLNKKYLEKALTPRPALAAPTHVPHEQKTHLPFGVNIAGYLQGEFGVGEIARASYQSITSVGVPSVLNNVEAAIYRQEDKTLEIFSSDNPYHFNLVHINADQANHFANLKGNQYFKNHHNIAYWFWELASFPRAWQSSFNQYQEIWVASSFCQASIAAQAPVPVVKMTQPVLIDPTKINPQRSRLGLPQQSFIFGFSFDYMSFIERKNPAAIIKAFQLAFEDRHDVLLLLKTTNGDQFPEQVQRLKIAAKGSNVRFINHYLAREEVINLIASLDSYVSLHRSEGLGIGMAQAMFLKKPVIATGYSGNMEFMNHNNSYLVPYKLAEIEEDHGPYKKGQHWADPDIEHAAMLMRQVYENQIRAQQIANQAAADIQASMSPTVTGRAMKERLLLMQ